MSIYSQVGIIPTTPISLARSVPDDVPNGSRFRYDIRFCRDEERLLSVEPALRC